MSHPDLVWICSVCDQERSEQHDCPGSLEQQLADLRAAIRRYLEARDAVQPEEERQARAEIERML